MRLVWGVLYALLLALIVWTVFLLAVFIPF